MTSSTNVNSEFHYDVCFSFAGEQRTYVKAVADILAAENIKVFYDEYEQVSLWGKDLYTHLDDIYRNKARYCVLFVSKDYEQKVWTNHERKSAQARALRDNKEYILPARFDDTDIPGLLPTIAYITLKDVDPPTLAELIKRKIQSEDANLGRPPTKEINIMNVKRINSFEHIYEISNFDISRKLYITTNDGKIMYPCPVSILTQEEYSQYLKNKETGFPSTMIPEGKVSATGPCELTIKQTEFYIYITCQYDDIQFDISQK